ncbi:hypothetical protein ACFVU3_03550 [Streptomyces sp. NPDC058052]|uniref:hypothetical protein n=1 Tax=Streptomyces sp. NPDC058052 TaxID=3346316 RepID=UPI0036E3C8AF
MRRGYAGAVAAVALGWSLAGAGPATAAGTGDGVPPVSAATLEWPDFPAAAASDPLATGWSPDYPLSEN